MELVKHALCAWLVMACAMSSVWAAPAASKARPPAASGKQGAAKPAPEPKGDPIVGREKSEAERCQECHGVDGHGQGHPNGTEGKFAKLAGQYPAYLMKQIRDLRSGVRKHDQMAIMARSVEDEDMRDILAYFASQPVMKGDGSGDSDVARKLYLSGDPGRGVIACVTCHGEKGKGVAGNPLMPVIGGQEPRYLEKQLLDWRSGDRRNSPDGTMNQVVKSLTDAEVQALVNYLSGL